MPLPIAPNEEARQHCLGRLRLLKDMVVFGTPTNIFPDAAKDAIITELCLMMSRMDMDDVCIVVEQMNIVKWSQKWGER